MSESGARLVHGREYWQMTHSNSFQVTFDASDPMTIAGFWAIALGYIVQPPPPGYETWEAFADEMDIPLEKRGDLAAIVDPDGVRPRILFQRVPEDKVVKNRVHLDINVAADLDEPTEAKAVIDGHVATLVAAGATKVEEFDDVTGRWTVMQDPDGNEFCVQ